MTARWRARLTRVVRALHRVRGAPDYDAYLAHHARAHPGTPPLSYGDLLEQLTGGHRGSNRSAGLPGFGWTRLLLDDVSM